MATGGGAPELLDDDGEMFRVFFSMSEAGAANPMCGSLGVVFVRSTTTVAIPTSVLLCLNKHIFRICSFLVF